MTSQTQGAIRPNSDLSAVPSDTTRLAATNHRLGGFSYFDIMQTRLGRAKGLAGLIGSAAEGGNACGVALEDLAEAAHSLREEIETAQRLLDACWRAEHADAGA